MHGGRVCVWGGLLTHRACFLVVALVRPWMPMVLVAGVAVREAAVSTANDARLALRQKSLALPRMVLAPRCPAAKHSSPAALRQILQMHILLELADLAMARLCKSLPALRQTQQLHILLEFAAVAITRLCTALRQTLRLHILLEFADIAITRLCHAQSGLGPLRRRLRS